MRSLVLSAALPLLLAIAGPVPAHNHPASHAAVAPTHRWATDAFLRGGMSRIRAEVAVLAHYEDGHLGPAQAVILAGDIQRDVSDVIAHCKLQPQADAALHPILAALVQGATTLKAHPRDLSSLPPMRRALQVYSRQFDDAP